MWFASASRTAGARLASACTTSLHPIYSVPQVILRAHRRRRTVALRLVSRRPRCGLRRRTLLRRRSTSPMFDVAAVLRVQLARKSSWSRYTTRFQKTQRPAQHERALFLRWDFPIICARSLDFGSVCWCMLRSTPLTTRLDEDRAYLNSSRCRSRLFAEAGRRLRITTTAAPRLQVLVGRPSSFFFQWPRSTYPAASRPTGRRVRLPRHSYI